MHQQLHPMQTYHQHICVNDSEKVNVDIKDMPEGSCIIAEGKVIKDDRVSLGCEIHLTGIEILSKPYEQMPIVINKKAIDVSLDVNLTNRPILQADNVFMITKSKLIKWYQEV